MKERLDDRVLAYLAREREERLRFQALMPVFMAVMGALVGRRHGYDELLPIMWFCGAAFHVAVIAFRFLTGRARF